MTKHEHINSLTLLLRFKNKHPSNFTKRYLTLESIGKMINKNHEYVWQVCLKKQHQVANLDKNHAIKTRKQKL